MDPTEEYLDWARLKQSLEDLVAKREEIKMDLRGILGGYILAMELAARAGSGDPSAGHSLGDTVLVNTVRALATELGIVEDAEVLIEKWEKLPKWYS